MARFPSNVEIAGVSFAGCRATLLDGQVFADSVIGTLEWGLDSTPHPQTYDTQYKGAQFGVTLGVDEGAVEISKVNQMISAIKAARSGFDFILEDEQYNIDVVCIPDWSQQWYSTGPYSEGYVKSVTLRLVIRQANSVSLSS